MGTQRLAEEQTAQQQTAELQPPLEPLEGETCSAEFRGRQMLREELREQQLIAELPHCRVEETPEKQDEEHAIAFDDIKLDASKALCTRVETNTVQAKGKEALTVSEENETSFTQSSEAPPYSREEFERRRGLFH